MRFLIPMLLALVAVVYAAAIDRELSDAKRELDNVLSSGDVDVVTSEVEGGRQKVEFIVDGELEGSIVETENGGVQGFDSDGNEIELDDLEETIEDEDEDEDDENEKRWIGPAIRILGPILKRFGSRAWTFFKCVGWSPELVQCSEKFLNCAQHGKAPDQCWGAIACVGKTAKACI